MITITELYIGDVKVTNIETTGFENNREFMSAHFIDDEETTEIPTKKNFTFSVSGVYDDNDTAHANFVDVPKEALEFKYYLGENKNRGFTLPVYVESCSLNHTGGEAVKFDASFKAAGPSVRI